MDTAFAVKCTRALLKRHGLDGWKVKLDRSKKRFGYCSYRHNYISLSAPIVELNDYAEVKDTILHEITHALTLVRTGEKGHGETWKAICREIGATLLSQITK